MGLCKKGYFGGGGRCFHSPKWQLFSTCDHWKDANLASVWHEFRSPFSVPFGIEGHECSWELFDHHLAGCVVCGKVHRCDCDSQCEEVYPGEYGYESYASNVKFGSRCPTEHTDDGNVVCRITGVCIRTCVYGTEYELMSHQGLSCEDIFNADRVLPSVCKNKASSLREEPKVLLSKKNQGHQQRGLVVSICMPSCDDLILVSKTNEDVLKQWDCMGGGGGSITNNNNNGSGTKKKKKHLSEYRRDFKVKGDIMKNKFHIERIAFWLRKLVKVVVQDENALYFRYLDACEKRNQLLSNILKKYKTEKKRGICLLTIAAKLEHAIKQSALKEASLQNVQCYRDPFDYLKIYSDEEIDAIVEKVLPYIYRLFSVLRTLDTNKYKGNNIPWMLLGMLYICMTGMTIGIAEVLPCVPELCNILPVDNRIVFYFGSFGINTKCVTDISNMINVTLKDQHSALKVLADI